jgi:hypothetical protein
MIGLASHQIGPRQTQEHQGFLEASPPRRARIRTQANLIQNSIQIIDS